jgi:hypothetical protein
MMTVVAIMVGLLPILWRHGTGQRGCSALPLALVHRPDFGRDLCALLKEVSLGRRALPKGDRIAGIREA